MKDRSRGPVGTGEGQVRYAYGADAERDTMASKETPDGSRSDEPMFTRTMTAKPPLHSVLSLQ